MYLHYVLSVSGQWSGREGIANGECMRFVYGGFYGISTFFTTARRGSNHCMNHLLVYKHANIMHGLAWLDPVRAAVGESTNAYCIESCMKRMHEQPLVALFDASIEGDGMILNTFSNATDLDLDSCWSSLVPIPSKGHPHHPKATKCWHNASVP